MVEAPILEAVPIATDADGVVRVSGTRVPLETVIGAFLEGATAEEVALRYTSLPLGDVYQVIAYYLRNKEKVDEYLDRAAAEAVDATNRIEARWNQAGIRARLLARRS